MKKTKTKKGKNDFVFVGVTMSMIEKLLIQKYYGNVSPNVRYLIQKQLSSMVFDDEFLELIENLPDEMKKRLSEIRTASKKRVYSKQDLKDIKEAEVI